MTASPISDETRKKIRKLLLAGATYAEIQEKTGIAPKQIYHMVHRMKEAGHQIQPKLPKREHHIRTVMRVGQGMQRLLADIPDETYDQLLRTPGSTWTEVLTNHLIKEASDATSSR